MYRYVSKKGIGHFSGKLSANTIDLGRSRESFRIHSTWGVPSKKLGLACFDLIYEALTLTCVGSTTLDGLAT